MGWISTNKQTQTANCMYTYRCIIYTHVPILRKPHMLLKGHQLLHLRALRHAVRQARKMQRRRKRLVVLQRAQQGGGTQKLLSQTKSKQIKTRQQHDNRTTKASCRWGCLVLPGSDCGLNQNVGVWGGGGVGPCGTPCAVPTKPSQTAVGVLLVPF